MTNASDYIITLPSGKLAVTEFPENKETLREVLALLTANEPITVCKPGPYVPYL